MPLLSCNSHHDHRAKPFRATSLKTRKNQRSEADMQAVDFYAILDVPRNADDDVIRSAYRKQVSASTKGAKVGRSGLTEIA